MCRIVFRGDHRHRGPEKLFAKLPGGSGPPLSRSIAVIAAANHAEHEVASSFGLFDDYAALASEKNTITGLIDIVGDWLI